MILHSLRTRLILLFTGSFCLTLAFMTVMAQRQLVKIVDTSQTEVYGEKLDTILAEIERTNQQLIRTGLPDAYRSDFQNRILLNLRNQYLRGQEVTVFPFIYNLAENTILLHPDIPEGHKQVLDPEELVLSQGKDEVQQYVISRGEKSWFIFREYPQWDWEVGFVVPLTEKYRDVRSFMHVQILLTAAVLLITLPFLYLILVGITRPIRRLTEISKKIAHGELEQEIPVRGEDEIATLAQSFIYLQMAIRQKIEALNREADMRFRMEEKLSHIQKMEAIGQLAGGISHDFNNMLGGIMGAAQLLEESVDPEDATSHEYIDLIFQATQRAADLTSRLLAFGRKTNLSSSAIELHEVIHAAMELVEKTISRKIRIVRQEDAGNSRIRGDFSALQNVLINLCLNASQAMPDGGTLVIRTRNMSIREPGLDSETSELLPGEYAVLEVEDTGIGMSPEIRKQIFNPFFTTRGMENGTGLGLSSAYGTVKNHLGSIHVYSEPGEGSVFQVILPCMGEEAAVQECFREPDWRGTGTVLLVDDEEMIRKMEKPLLEKMGFTVFLAEDGEQALEIYSRLGVQIRLVISDMIMPRMDGRELFLKIREINPGCPFILASGFMKEEVFQELTARGLSGFIQKPFHSGELSVLLHKLFPGESPENEGSSGVSFRKE